MGRLTMVPKVNWTAREYIANMRFHGVQLSKDEYLKLSALMMKEESTLSSHEIFDTPYTDNLLDAISDMVFTDSKIATDRVIELIKASVVANYVNRIDELVEENDEIDRDIEYWEHPIRRSI